MVAETNAAPVAEGEQEQKVDKGPTAAEMQAADRGQAAAPAKVEKIKLEPSIGRIVHFGTDPKKNNGAAFAPAMITAVHNPKLVNLTVFLDTDAGVERKTSVSLCKDGEHIEGRWFWPQRV